jgi:hypothetical protein
MVALGAASIAKAWLLKRLLGAPVNGWRWSLVLAGVVAGVAGWGVTRLPHHFEWVELAVGVPLILGVYGAIVWFRGFSSDDRALFRSSKSACPSSPETAEVRSSGAGSKDGQAAPG